ncbi:MAG: hypothetical protein JWL77_1384 [Chthonomonadaceae bacterium]|nr:hypothetical protein [Chthonomonadaceae bacterium]
MPLQNSREIGLQRVVGERSQHADDVLAVEEPLEIRLGYWRDGKREQRSLSITMRTPGDDFDLAAGFLFTEGIVQRPEQIDGLRYCGIPAPDTGLRNVVRIDLAPDVVFDLKRIERHFYTTSSCGVCGKTSLEALEMAGCPAPLSDRFRVPACIVHRLPLALRSAQECFDRTGGLHAAALFDAEGNLLRSREDVGRHNALDKLIGSYLREGAVPLANRLLLVSGRASFELMQKALMAGIPILAAVGAPSSLAVELAQRFNVTLLGFVREHRFNIYHGAERIETANASETDGTTVLTGNVVR